MLPCHIFSHCIAKGFKFKIYLFCKDNCFSLNFVKKNKHIPVWLQTSRLLVSSSKTRVQRLQWTKNCMGTQKSPVFVRANRFFQTMYLNTQTPPGWLAPTIALGNWVWSNITFFLKKKFSTYYLHKKKTQ